MRRRFGMTFQFGALFDSLPIWENVTFRMRHQQKMKRAEARDLAVETITQLGLSPMVIDQYPAELSGGMQKRVALARAIADKPEILLFDEPTSGLDPITGGVIDRLIIDAVQRLGATTMTISHDMASVRRIADKVAMIHNGVIIWCGPVADMDNSGVPEVDQFVHGRAEGPLTTAAQEAARQG
jgi:phospholipid/cholesterol/gamma-HCH transport system ATP-binding protein